MESTTQTLRDLRGGLSSTELTYGNPVFIDSLAGARESLVELEQYVRVPKARLSLDFETFGQGEEIPRPTPRSNGQIRLMQLGTDPDLWEEKQFVFDVQKIGTQVVGNLFRELLETSQILGQNLKYEYQFSWARLNLDLGGRASQPSLLCLMLMSQVLNAGDKVQHGLGGLYRRNFDPFWFLEQTGKTFEQYEEFKAEQQKIDWSADLTPENIQYAADDVRLVFPLREALREKIQQWRNTHELKFPAGRGMVEVIKLECSLIPLFALMELRGVKLDEEYHRDTLIPYLELKKDQAERALNWVKTTVVKKTNRRRGLNKKVWDEVFTEPMNLISWKQVTPKLNEIISADLGEPFEIPSTEEDDIREVFNRHKDRLSPQTKSDILNLLQFKKSRSLLGKYGQKLLDLAQEGYIHPSWFQIGTDENSVDSGRSSCADCNMQQIPSRGTLFVNRWDKNRPITFDQSQDQRDGVSVMQFFRKSFVAEDGWILIDADYSQEEPRVAAQVCQEENMTAEFLKPGKVDVHSIVGKSMCGLDYYPQKGEFERDYIGKTAGLQLLYGAYWTSLKQFMFHKTDGKVDWDDQQAQTAYNRFFEAYPGFKSEMERVRSEVESLAAQCKYSLAPFKKDRLPFAFSWTLMGRARRFCLTVEQCKLPDFILARGYRKPEVDDKGEPVLDAEGKQKTTWKNLYREKMSSAGREAFNHVIQGTSADILKLAVLQIHREFKARRWDWREGIILLVHDEVVAHVRAEHTDEAVEIIRDSMKSAFEKLIPEIPCAIDVHCARSWAEAKG